MTLEEEITELKRELATRKRVYPDWVRNAKLRQSVADHRIACLESIIKRLEKILADNAGEQTKIFG